LLGCSLAWPVLPQQLQLLTLRVAGLPGRGPSNN
jgi:hypothetical protein